LINYPFRLGSVCTCILILHRDCRSLQTKPAHSILSHASQLSVPAQTASRSSSRCRVTQGCMRSAAPIRRACTVLYSTLASSSAVPRTWAFLTAHALDADARRRDAIDILVTHTYPWGRGLVIIPDRVHDSPEDLLHRYQMRPTIQSSCGRDIAAAALV